MNDSLKRCIIEPTRSTRIGSELCFGLICCCSNIIQYATNPFLLVPQIFWCYRRATVFRKVSLLDEQNNMFFIRKWFIRKKFSTAQKIKKVQYWAIDT